MRPLHALAAAALLAACGDRCELLCVNAGAAIAECRTSSLTWFDVGAEGRNDFVQQCRSQWDRERLELSASEVRVALDTCSDTSRELQDLTCEEVRALYAPVE